MTHPAENGLPNAGPWEHVDGTPCPHYWASRPNPVAGQLWWCTEHQKHVQVASPAENEARPPHEHDVSCAFGNPTCPAFGEPEPPRPSLLSRIRACIFPPATPDHERGSARAERMGP